MLGIAAAAIASCSENAVGPAAWRDKIGGLSDCDLNLDFMVLAGAVGSIPALDSPRFVLADERVPAYLEPDARIIGVTVGFNQYAIPHSVLWSHEITNFRAGGIDLTVTYCPLTGSSLAFDRAAANGEPFAISGLLYQNNLVMIDLRGTSSLWPQMIGQARCGEAKGTTLEQWPVMEMEWAEWLELHPLTWVLDGDQGFNSEGVPWTYESDSYPYGSYETDEEFFSSAMPDPDARRHPKERVLGVPSSSAEPGIAFPFGALTAEPGRFTTVGFTYEGEPAVVLWDEEAQGGMAFRPRTESGTSATVVATDSGFEDEETGSRWSLDGLATSGPLTGEHLVPLGQTHVAFWGAWSAFHPLTVLWEG